MNNNIVESSTLKKNIEWITIEATITKQNGTNVLKLNRIFNKSYQNRVIYINGKNVTSDVLKDINLKTFPYEDFILLSENNISEEEFTKNANDNTSKYNNFGILNNLKNFNIYSLGFNEKYDPIAKKSYNDAYTDWIESTTKWIKSLETEIESETNRVKDELQNASKELSQIQTQIYQLKFYTGSYLKQDEDDEYNVTQEDVANANKQIDQLVQKEKNINELISNLNIYLTYIQTEKYKRINVQRRRTAQEYLDKLKNLDDNVVLINCVYFTMSIRDRTNLKITPLFYLIDVNQKVSFNKNGVMSIDDSQESFSLMQKLKNIKIDKESINKIVEFYASKKTKTKSTTSKPPLGFSSVSSSASTNFNLGDFFNSLSTFSSGGEKPRYSRKNPKCKRRKYSVKNKI